MRRGKRDNSVLLRMNDVELKRLDDLANLCGLSRTEMMMECVKFSAHRVSKKYIKKFVEKALEIPDPFDSMGGVFDPPPKSEEEFEARVTEKCLALAGKLKMPKGSKKKTYKKGERFENGYSQADFYNAADDEDQELAEKTLKM